jgi:hypothetical protein
LNDLAAVFLCKDSRRPHREILMDAKHVEALEDRLVQDVAEYRRALTKAEPALGRLELEQKVGEYTASRKAVLGLFIRAES